MLKSLISLLLLFFIYDPQQSGSRWETLLDQDLSQWERYLSYRHAPDYNGKIPLDVNGNLVNPIGYNNDTSNVFKMVMLEGAPALRISGEIYGCLYTRTEYENYHLQVQVKWGEHKSVPRTDKLKDSGILYHSIGEAGVDYWRAWMLSQEFQIMEGHMGDYWNIASSAIDIRAYISEGTMNSVANAKQSFRSFGTDSDDGFCLRSENHESAPGAWTTLELICVGDKSVHIVNGHVVMVLKNSRYVKDGKVYPLTKGRIQLQSEAAEVYFRSMRIRQLNAMPDKYASLF